MLLTLSSVYTQHLLYCRFSFPYNIQRHVLNRREAKSAVKAAKDSKESVAQQQLVCDEDTEESCCVYTRRSSPFNFGGWWWEEFDETDGTQLMFRWRFLCVLLYWKVFEWPLYHYVLLRFRSIRLTRHTLRDKSSKESLGRPSSFIWLTAIVVHLLRLGLTYFDN